MTEHAFAACAQRLPLGRPATSSSSGCTAALCDPIAPACRTLCMAPMKEGRLLAEDGSGRPFRVIAGVASADQRGGVGSHGGLTGFGGGNHGGLQLDLLGGHLAAGGTGGGPEGVFGGFLSGLSLADLLDGHGGVVVVGALAPDAHTVTRGGRAANLSGGQFTSRNPWRTLGLVA
jgi:hypothetical protein